jgi:hypothetical protein
MTLTKKLLLGGASVVLLVLTFAAGWMAATLGMGPGIDPSELPRVEQEFIERLRASSLVGYFTVAGRESQPANPDRYDISSVEKVGDDRWRFNARMRHGNVDVSLPVTVTMRWQDDTPMIILTDFSLPSMGTFSARVFFYGDRYAGTWQHDKVGGHMYGRIEKQAAP